MTQSTLDRIRAHLRSQGIVYAEREHGPTFTSEESAAARGETLETGAKALLLKTDDAFRLFVVPAHKKLDSGAV
jgi:prolyl-tRNA editing enzyme YbaK/EbsC (Cys-tRNA(Pro) deacylase)